MENEYSKCSTLDYEAEYHRVMKELEVAKYETSYLRDELMKKNEKSLWNEGFKTAVELIFSGRMSADGK